MKKLIHISITAFFLINLVSYSKAEEVHICETKTLGIVTYKDFRINNKDTKEYFEGSGVCAYPIYYSNINNIYVYYYPRDKGCHNGDYVAPPANYAGKITLTHNPDERYGWVDAIENILCFYK